MSVYKQMQQVRKLIDEEFEDLYNDEFFKRYRDDVVKLTPNGARRHARAGRKG